MKKVYKMKRTLSIKSFISQFGKSFSEHMKDRLSDLEVRSVLTRKDVKNQFDLKHVEHIKYDETTDSGSSSEKEYSYGQFIVEDEVLYFSEKCLEDKQVKESPIVETIYNNLSGDDMISLEEPFECCAKKVDDSNIDYIVDTILTVFPDVSQKYLDIVKDMTYRAKNKKDNYFFTH
ncbi:hypothetical protein [Clostridium oceanicum]|uniref:Uncharacterized protein n=1 Tax=Clostridium oceanicum TaxID=1543 RepID=A0ABP3UJY1_9CLOT